MKTLERARREKLTPPHICSLCLNDDGDVGHISSRCMTLSCKMKTLQREGGRELAGRAGGLFTSLYHCYQTSDPHRAALSVSEQPPRDPF